MNRGARTVTAGLLAAVLLAGCSGGSAEPQRPVDKLQAAIDARDYKAAYYLMPEAFRRTYSEEEFGRLLRGEIVVPDHSPDAGPGSALEEAEEYSMASPRRALESFVLAYERGRWDVMVQLVPDQYREHVTPETIEKQFEEESVREQMRQLADAIDGPIAENGDEARLRYGQSREVKLVRENGQWKIGDLD